MRLPWTITHRARIEDLEHRADSSYTDALVAALTSHATGQAQTPYATAALEACVGLVDRAFTSAEVNAPGMVQAALTPSCMGMIGRALMRRGEILLAIDTEGGGVDAAPCQLARHRRRIHARRLAIPIEHGRPFTDHDAPACAGGRRCPLHVCPRPGAALAWLWAATSGIAGRAAQRRNRQRAGRRSGRLRWPFAADPG